MKTSPLMKFTERAGILT